MPIIESHCQTVGIETVLWRCPRCGRRFANRNQSHACGRYQLEDHLVGRDPNVVAAFRALLAAARRNGPVTVLPEKTRIAFQVRMSFAAFTLKKHLLHGHVVLARRRDSARSRRSGDHHVATRSTSSCSAGPTMSTKKSPTGYVRLT